MKILCWMKIHKWNSIRDKSGWEYKECERCKTRIAIPSTMFPAARDDQWLLGGKFTDEYTPLPNDF